MSIPSIAPALRAWLAELELDEPSWLSSLLECALPAGAGESALAANTLSPGALPLELSFSEAEPEALRVDVQPTGADAAAIRQAAWRIARAVGGGRASFDRDGLFTPRAPSFGAFVGVSASGSSLRVKVYEETGGDPAAVTAIPAALREAIPGVEPVLAELSVSAGHEDRRWFLLPREGLAVLALEPWLREVDLLHRLPRLATTVLALTGGRMHLAPGQALLGVTWPEPGACELKLELLRGTHGEDDAGWLAVVQGLLANQPGARAFRRWCGAVERAFARDHHLRFNAVSVRVSRRANAELNVYLGLRPRSWRTVARGSG